MGNIGQVVPLLWGSGWFPLTYDDIDENVDSRPGCYMLGRLHGSIVVKTRTGSSGNLNSRLKDHAGDGYYHVFRFAYTDDMDDDEELSEALLSREDEIYDSTHGVIGLGHGERERPKRHRV
jgi:hypothetical protein